MKRILSLLAICAAACVTLFAVVPASARTTATTVKVTAKEYKFVLSTKTARHGTVIFKVTNKGKIKHDFKIAGKKTPMLRPGKTASLTVTLAKGKTYTYICTVPGHAQLGMKGKFKAT
jgi:uncharacterized cupredoxin-like copper-binding protein